MPRVRFSPEYSMAFGSTDNLVLDVEGRTVRDVLEAAAKEVGRAPAGTIFLEDEGRIAGIAPDVKVTVDGREVERPGRLDQPVEREVVLEPLKGNASSFDNSPTPKEG